MNYSNSAISLGEGLPNLPGMSPNKNSWVYREKDGFKRSTTISRPQSAAPRSAFTAGKEDNDTPWGNQSTNFNRPSTANLSRPHTASNASLRGSASNVSLRGNSWFPEDGMRRSTDLNLSASTSLISNPRPYTADPVIGGRNPSYGTLRNTASTDFIKMPNFVETDKKVARFYGYLMNARLWARDGPLGNPQVEQNMVRKFTFYYYIYDDTIEISEPRGTNTGLSQGIFFKRGPLYKPDGTQLKIMDLIPGSTFPTLGQEFHITDADDWTRGFLNEEYGVDVPGRLDQPPDMDKTFGAQYATGLGSPTRSSKPNFNSRSTDYLTTKQTFDKTYRFLKYDGQVLRFLCVEVPYLYPPYFPNLEQEILESGEDIQKVSNGHGFIANQNAKKFAVSYYLSSMQVDVVLNRTSLQGIGADEPKLLFKKSRLAKNWRDVQRGIAPVYYDTQDFECGQVIDVCGRLFLIVDCDSYTRDYFLKNHSMKQYPVTLIKPREEEIVQPIPSLGDGFLPIGSEEDTLATVYGQAKVTRNVQKISRNQGRLLRCKAVMLTDCPIDSSREFFITFYLEDDTVHVYEEPRRNSGIWGGTFLKRGKYRVGPLDDDGLPLDDTVDRDPISPSLSRYFCPGDIYLGNVLWLNGSKFHIIEMDNLSLKFCETYPDEFPQSDTFRIVGGILMKIMSGKVDIRRMYAQNDPTNSGTVLQSTFVEILENNGLIDGLTDQELLTVLRRFSDPADTRNPTGFNSAADTLRSAAQDGSTPFSGVSVNGQKYPKLYYLELCDLASHLFAVHYLKQRRSQDNTYDEFAKAVRCRTVQWRRVLRRSQFSVNGHISVAHLREIFQHHGQTVSDDLIKEIIQRFSSSRQFAEATKADLARRGLSIDSAIPSSAKFSKSKKTTTKSLLRNQLAHASALASRISSLRRSQTKSLLRPRDSFDGSTIMPEFESSDIQSMVVDFNALCDAIYTCDWV